SVAQSALVFRHMVEGIREQLAGRLEPMLDLLRRLVDQNSYTDNPDGGARVFGMLADELGLLPEICIRRVPSQRFAPHLIASTRVVEAFAAGCIALIGHLDTVFAPGSFEGFVRQDGVARGPGVLDMKGGLCVVTEALRALSRIGVFGALP